MRKVHIEITKITGTCFEDHDHKNILHEIIEVDDHITNAEVIGHYSIEVYNCDDEGKSLNKSYTEVK